MSFTLDYEQTKYTMRLNWRSLTSYPESYEDAFNDTYADYLEGKDKIPSHYSHIAWFRMRMWNNVNKYAPYGSMFTGSREDRPATVEYNDELLVLDCDPEKSLILEDMKREWCANKWGIPVDTTHPIGLLFLKGHSKKEVMEMVEDGGGKSARYAVEKALRELRSEHDQQESEGGG